MIALDPAQTAYRGIRALIRYETGRKQASLDDLDWFLQHAPPGTDADAILRMRERLDEEKAQAVQPK
jgi:regulator of sirC expression with transglutaminase-like and TPR domain